MDGMLISIIVFLVVYAAITFELVNKAVAAFSGVAVLILLHVIDEHEGVEYSFSIHSNDIIKLELINHIITEKGEITKDQIPTILDQIVKEY